MKQMCRVFFYSIFGQCLHVYGSFWMHRCIQREKEDKMNDVELFFQRRQLFLSGLICSIILCMSKQKSLVSLSSKRQFPIMSIYFCIGLRIYNEVSSRSSRRGICTRNRTITRCVCEDAKVLLPFLGVQHDSFKETQIFGRLLTIKTIPFQQNVNKERHHPWTMTELLEEKAFYLNSRLEYYNCPEAFFINNSSQQQLGKVFIPATRHCG